MTPFEIVRLYSLYAEYIREWMIDHKANKEDWFNSNFEDEGISETSDCFVCFDEWYNNEYTLICEESEKTNNG